MKKKHTMMITLAGAMSTGELGISLSKMIKNNKVHAISATGANVEEAIGAQSRKDFFAKLTIAYKEARESHYWIRLLKDTEYILKERAEELLNDVEEILRIIGSIQKSIRNS